MNRPQRYGFGGKGFRSHKHLIFMKFRLMALTNNVFNSLNNSLQPTPQTSLLGDGYMKDYDRIIIIILLGTVGSSKD